MPERRYSLHTDGANHLPAALSRDDLVALSDAIRTLPHDLAGVRVHGLPQLTAIISPSAPAGAAAVVALGKTARPVRAVLFDKSEKNNWSLDWHQDRTIVVRSRREVEGYGLWSVKSGLQHVAPPFSILASMMTMRIHLDPVDAHNAPLLVALGSHRLGSVRHADVAKAAASCGQPLACLAEAGDIWLYSTPILHASERAAHPRRRRVLQVDFAAVRSTGVSSGSDFDEDGSRLFLRPC